MWSSPLTLEELRSLRSVLSQVESAERAVDEALAEHCGWQRIASRKRGSDPAWRSPSGKVLAQVPRFTKSLEASLDLLRQRLPESTGSVSFGLNKEVAVLTRPMGHLGLMAVGRSGALAVCGLVVEIELSALSGQVRELEMSSAAY